MGQFTPPKRDMVSSYGSYGSYGFYLKSRGYINKPPTIDELKWYITDEITNIGQDMLERAF